MSDRRARFVTALLVLCVGIGAAEVKKISSAEAKDHIGERCQVCGGVASTKYLENSSSQPTFLNFDRPFPRHTFTVVIFGRDRAKFTEAPEVKYQGKKICVSGLIQDYKGKPQIIVKSPDQIGSAE